MRVLHHRLLDSLEKRERSTSFWHRAWTSYVCVSVVFDPAVSRTTDQSRLIASMVRAHVLVLAISLDSERERKGGGSTVKDKDPSTTWKNAPSI